MPLEVQPLVDSDSDAWACLFYPVFKPSAVGCLWNREPSEDSLSQIAEQLRRIRSKPDAHVFKCVDTDLSDQLIGVAFWNIHGKERTPEEVEAGFVARDPFPEENRAARLEFMQGLWAAQREVMGTKPFICLENLMVHPDHQRRGVGKLLMKWGLKKSEELGIVAYLEASPEGKGLYEKVGYKRAGKDIIFKATKYGSKEDDVHVAMIREP